MNNNTNNKHKPLRQKVIDFFSMRFKRIPEFARFHHALANNLEKSIYDYAQKNDNESSSPETVYLNITRYRHGFIHVNFITYPKEQHQYAQGVRDKIIKKELKIQDLIKYSRKELDFIGQYQKSHELWIRTRNYTGKTKQLQELEKSHQGVFQCARCRSWKTNYVQVQTRSADEGMTVMAHCEECGHKWKFS